MPYSLVLKSDRGWLTPFRRALTKEDQEAFDRLFDRAKMHASAGVYMSNPWPMETILLSICLEHGKMIEEFLGLLKAKKTQRLSIFPGGLVPRFPTLLRILQSIAEEAGQNQGNFRPSLISPISPLIWNSLEKIVPLIKSRELGPVKKCRAQSITYFGQAHSSC